MPARGDWATTANTWGRLCEESGFWRFVDDPADPGESQTIELLLAHSAGYVELFTAAPEPVVVGSSPTLARSKSGVLVGGAKRLYGIVDGGDLAYVEERVDADGGLVPHLSARLSRYVGWSRPAPVTRRRNALCDPAADCPKPFRPEPDSIIVPPSRKHDVFAT